MFQKRSATVACPVRLVSVLPALVDHYEARMHSEDATWGSILTEDDCHGAVSSGERKVLSASPAEWEVKQSMGQMTRTVAVDLKMWKTSFNTENVQIDKIPRRSGVNSLQDWKGQR